MLRVVLDTNVIVSGILSKNGASAEILNAWRARRFYLLSSPLIVAEVRAVFQYPRLREKYCLSDEEIELTIALLESDALIVQGDVKVSGMIPDDPKNEMIYTMFK